MEQSQLSKGSFTDGVSWADRDGAAGVAGAAGRVDASGGALAAAAPEFAELVGALCCGMSDDLAGVAAMALVAGGVEEGTAVVPAFAGGLEEHATRIVRAPDTTAWSRR